MKLIRVLVLLAVLIAGLLSTGIAVSAAVDLTYSPAEAIDPGFE